MWGMRMSRPGQLDIVPLLADAKTRRLGLKLIQKDLASARPDAKLSRAEVRELDPETYLTVLKLIDAKPGRAPLVAKSGDSESVRRVLSRLSSFDDAVILDAFVAHFEAHPKDVGAMRKFFNARGPMIPPGQGGLAVLQPAVHELPERLTEIDQRTRAFLRREETVLGAKFPSATLANKLIEALKKATVSDRIRFSR